VVVRCFVEVFVNGAPETNAHWSTRTFSQPLARRVAANPRWVLGGRGPRTFSPHVRTARLHPTADVFHREEVDAD